MSNSYWATALAQRQSRRRILTMGAMLGAGALATSLLSCGSNSGGGSKDTTSGNQLTAQPVDTTKQAVRGGTMSARQQVDAPHFDPTTGGIQTWAHSQLAYSRLVRYKLGTFSTPPDGSLEGDLAQSWEYSPDGLQVTMKLRPGMKLDSRAPTNGRAITSDDVKFTVGRYQTLSPDRGNYFTSIQPDAPIDSFQYPDANTVVMKLSYPLGSIMKRFGANFFIVPTEADGKFDMRQDQRGSGPWVMTNYARSQGWQYQRNPSWYNADRPFLDGIDYTLITEGATALSQFKAKRLWYLTPSAENVTLLKKENLDSILHAVSPLASGISGGYMLALSKLADSPIQKDVRIRYAISNLIDRDLWIDTFYNVSKLQQEGLPMDTGWNSHVSCTAAEWLDPKSEKTFGENAKYFKHDPAQATQLLKAAGKFPMETEFSYATSNLNQPDSPKWMQVLQGMLEGEGHFKLKVNTGDYISWYQPQYLRTRAQWEGIAWTPGGGAGTDIDAALWAFWAPNSRNDGVYDYARVPGLQDFLQRERRETDDKKRTAIVQDFQREMAKQMPCMLFPGLATTFNFYWPWMGNHGVFKTYSGDGIAPDTLVNVWYDKAKEAKS